MNHFLPFLINISSLLFVFGLGHLIGGFQEWNKPDGTREVVKQNHALRKINAQLREASAKVDQR